MNFETVSHKIEKRILPLANKMSTQKHLKAIRNTFTSIMPITLIGSIVTIIEAVPLTKNTTNAFLLAWADFTTQNSLLLAWIYNITLGSISLYVCIGVTHFLSKHYKIDVFCPILLSLIGFMMLCVKPFGLEKDIVISSLGGQGIILGILIGIVTVEIYGYVLRKNWNKLPLLNNIPTAFSKTPISLVPSLITLFLYIILFIIFIVFKTTVGDFLSSLINPILIVSDSLFLLL